MNLGRRIVIIGPSCSGKSTLGSHLATRMGVPFVELDALHWAPGWTEVDSGIFRSRVDEASRGDSWVLAGNYSQQQDISWPRADTVIWLDFALGVCLRRTARRTFRRWWSREVLWGTNRERLLSQLKLWDEDASLIAYTVRHHRERRIRFEAAMVDPQWAHISFHRLRSQGEVDDRFRSVSWPGAVASFRE